mmetsp:Transcript_39136/g.115981  ORF Transcript_39136/g.115981 Transcript_39136/m.115981 type:complete len:229 (-) Transcript_39136:182-868(-)
MVGANLRQAHASRQRKTFSGSILEGVVRRRVECLSSWPHDLPERFRQHLPRGCGVGEEGRLRQVRRSGRRRHVRAAGPCAALVARAPLALRRGRRLQGRQRLEPLRRRLLQQRRGGDAAGRPVRHAVRAKHGPPAALALRGHLRLLRGEVALQYLPPPRLAHLHLLGRGCRNDAGRQVLQLRLRLRALGREPLGRASPEALLQGLIVHPFAEERVEVLQEQVRRVLLR